MPPNRPALKLKLSTSSIPTHANPLSSTASTPKIKLKIGGSSSATSAPASSHSDKPVIVFSKSSSKKPKPRPTPSRTSSSSKPTSKKRSKPSADDPPASSTGSIKRLKIHHNPSLKPLKHGTPIIQIRAKGKPPPRPLGVGYDSESSDRETDPHIEEEFILRFPPSAGADSDYVREAISSKKIGLSKKEGGADITMKFLNREGRRAVVTVRGRHYAATMVDLPCIVEAMKSWDRRGWWKTADVCQMLLVIGRIETEAEAMTVPLPAVVDAATFQFAHGLTPPMHYVRRNRFRKRISRNTIEAVEDEVERLLEADADVGAGGSSAYEIVDMGGQDGRDDSVGLSEDVDEDEDEDGDGGEGEDDDAEGVEDDGEVVYAYADAAEGGAGGEDDDIAGELEADIEAALMKTDEGVEGEGGELVAVVKAEEAAEGVVVVPAAVAAGGAAVVVATDTTTITAAGTPSTTAATPVAEATSSEEDDDEEEEEDDDDGGEDDIDEDALARQKDMERQKEEIADLEAAIESEKKKLGTMSNSLFRARQLGKIRSLEGDLELKRGVGAADDDEEEEEEGGRA